MNGAKSVTKTVEALRRVRSVRNTGAALAVAGLATVVMAGAAGAATKPVVSTAKTAQFGTILVSGRTVYTLKPSKVACAAQCLGFWPAVLLPKGATKARAGSGVSAARLGTVKSKSGSLQVTYGGKPLYYFVKDTAAGQVNGNITDEWGKWSVVVTVKPAHASSGGTATTSAGSGGVSF